MGYYFVGHVYVFHTDPEHQLPLIDVPAISQSPGASNALLLQIAEAELTDESKARLARFTSQSILPFDILRANQNVDPDEQLRIAETIGALDSAELAKLHWSGAPRYPQLFLICKIIWECCGGARLGGGSARSPQQLAVMLQKLQGRPTIDTLILDQSRFVGGNMDGAVTAVLDFLRLWAQFHFPRLLRAINAIQRHVLGQKGLPTGNYDWFAGQVEKLFLSPVLLALDEYGLPLEIGRKLSSYLGTSDDLDAAISRLRTLNLSQVPLTQFEIKVLRLVQDEL